MKKRTISATVSLPTVSEAKKLTMDDVWGIYDNHERISDGMIIAKTDEVCPIFFDLVPYKSVTVVCKIEDKEEVEYWLEYVHGGNSVSKRLFVPTGDYKGMYAMRSDYQCW